jgi:alginate O-acetyltransferase complex protein AlgI
MLFNSPQYIFLFLPLTILVYFLLSSRNKLSKTWLVFASLFFYGWWNPKYLLIISISIIVNYQFGRLLIKHRHKSRAGLVFGVAFNIGLLAYFKYANFIVDNFNLIAGGNYGPLDIVLPLAISFFTFQQISYLADCYSGHNKSYDFLDYSLFVTFFPQLIAGPIVHHKEMMPQFSKIDNSIFSSKNLAKGVFVFSLGLFKKMIIADSFAVWAIAGFDSDTTLTFFDAWAVSLSYTFQLYYDFSGYADMAIGAAMMFNIRLPINFNSPYKAANIQDFWRRWHMTLSRWLKNYVYIPLGGNRSNKVRAYLNLFLTFLIGGIWHGAGWTFVIWGALHGSALVIHRIWRQAGFKMPAAAGCFLTFMFVNFSFIFFRAKDIDSATRILKGMLGQNGHNVSSNFVLIVNTIYGIPEKSIGTPNIKFVTDLVAFQYLIIFGFIALIAPNTMQIANHGFIYEGKFLYKQNSTMAIFAGAAAGFSTLLLFTKAASEFLYFNF